MPVNISEDFVRQLMQDYQEQRQLNIEQNKQNLELTDKVATLTAKIEELTQTIKDLEEKLNKNSKNSSKPPSSDGLKKPNRNTSLREKTNKKQGAQPGHEGTRMIIVGEPDHVTELIPTACQKCPHWKNCKETSCNKERRYKVDITITQTLEAYDAYKVVCPKSNETLKGIFPDDIKGEIQYGENIAAFIVALNTVGAVSAKRVQEIAGSLFDLPISTGTVCKMLARCAENSSDAMSFIKEKVIQLESAHFDETGTRVAGKTGWVHVAGNDELTYLFFGKRGHEGMTEMGILPEFSGVAIHDCWGSYWKFPVSHAICCAHLLRELNGVIENHPQQTWAKSFKDLLLRMKKLKEKAISKGKTELSYYHLHNIEMQYDVLIQTALEENPIPEKEPGKKGRQKKGKVRALIERLQKYKDEVCLFVKDFKIEFDNNQAERDLRMIKTKTKVSGCFRTEEGIQNYLTVMSYVGTAKKHGKNAFEAIRNIFNNNWMFAFE